MIAEPQVVFFGFFNQFRSMRFANQWSEYVENKLFFWKFEVDTFEIQWQHDAELVISGGEIGDLRWSIFILILVVFKQFQFLKNASNLITFANPVKLSKIENRRFSLDVQQKLMILLIVRRRQGGQIFNIIGDV